MLELDPEPYEGRYGSRYPKEVPGTVWAPRVGYEQDISAYGFKGWWQF